MGDVHSSGFCNELSNGTDSKEETNEDGPHAILFVFLVFLTGVIVRWILKSISVPYTVVVFILGALIGIATNRFTDLQHYTTVTRLEPHMMLEVFLPILIFESAFSMDAHTFLKCIVNVITLAVPGVLVCTVLSAIFARYVFLSYNFNWYMALIFGSILSATDPVAVVSLLRELGASQQLSILIEGESLLNDGTAIVLYQVLIGIMKGQITAGRIATYSLQITLGGPLVGLIIGKIAIFALLHVYNDAVIEITITLCATYLTFYLSENVLHVSGVLACTALGVFMSANKASISPEVESTVHSFWSMLGYYANTLIFIIAGILITERGVKFVQDADWFLILATYMAITFFRFVAVTTLSPILCRCGYGLTWREAVLLVWGGLRGAVSLALGLTLAQDKQLEYCHAAHKIFIHVAGVVVLTLIVNAITLKPLLRLLGMTKISQAKQITMANAIDHLHKVVQESSQIQKMNRCLLDANWLWVNAHTTIKNPYLEKKYKIEEKEEHLVQSVRQTHCPHCSNDHIVPPTEQELKELYEEARLKILKAQKVFFWQLFEHGLLSRRSILILIELADTATDQEGAYINIDELMKHMKPPKLFLIMKYRVWVIVRWLHYGGNKYLYDTDRTHVLDDIHEVNLPSQEWRQKCFQITKHKLFRPLVNIVIVVAAITIGYAIHELSKDIYLDGGSVFRFLESCHFIAVSFFTLEAILKISGSGWKNYWMPKWNCFDFIITVLSLLALSLNFVAFSIKQRHHKIANHLLITSKVIPVLRVIRLITLMEPLMQLILKLLTDEVHNQLYAGYDVGRGFLISIDEIKRKLNKMVDYTPVSLKLNEMLSERKLTVLKEQIKMRKNYPEIVVAASSHFAARKILNEAVQAVDSLAVEGLVDSAEFLLIEETIREMITKLARSPGAIPVSMRPAEVLSKIAWFMDDQLFSFVSKYMTLETLPTGYFVHQAGQYPSGIRIISSGVVKVYGEVTESTDGYLQNADSFFYYTSTGPMIDYVSISFVLGIFGVLNKKPFVTNAVCETDVECIFIPIDQMRQALVEFTKPPSLLYKIWKHVAIEIALPLIQELSIYQSLSYDRIRIKAESAVMPDLEKETSFQLDSSLEAAFLIQGLAEDQDTGEQYKGPTYLHYCARKLSLPGDPETRPRPILLLLAPPGFSVPAELDWSGDTLIPSEGICDIHKVLDRWKSMLQKHKVDAPEIKKSTPIVDSTFTDEVKNEQGGLSPAETPKREDSLVSLNKAEDIYKDTY